ncbi:tetratricopeptide repeat protein [Paraglaciecola sp. 2405UD69-4]|uniref:tetratricopeptide repeat protein n=1 Tax=Paraglaciecola sp. 2405UD69-4 TaxID=3391836 RepID=UPI0039C901A4
MDGDFQAAYSNLTIAYQAQPTPSNAKLIFQALSSLHGKDKAISFLRKHIQEQPADVQNQLLYAGLLLTTNTDNAITTYQQMIELSPNSVIAHNNLAYLLMEKGQLKYAHKYALNALSLTSDNIMVLDTLGSIELKLGKKEKALERFKMAYSVSGGKLEEQTWLHYIESLLVKGQKELAKRRIGQFTPISKSVTEKLAQLQRDYF